MHLKCHMLKSSDAKYLLASLAYAIVEANSVDQYQQQSILCLLCLTQRLLKQFKNMIKAEDFVVISVLRTI